MKIKFYGAAKEVTGSKHVITTQHGIQILLDCGMFQGKGNQNSRKNYDFGFQPKGIDYLILSHAHIDHSGLIPKLIKDGFRGKIFCTPATLELCNIMLLDSAHIQEADVKFINRRRALNGKPPLEPLYTKQDVEKSWEYFHAVPLDKSYQIDENIALKFTDAGHILGSAVVNLSIQNHGTLKRICYTGDIGRYTNKILRKPQVPPQADVIISESTYGDRIHETVESAAQRLLEIVLETCVKNKGKLIVPAFSIGKTQELVFALNKLAFNGQLPPVKVYVDSPLAINATSIMQRHPECFGKETLEFMRKDPDPFGFSQLTYIREANLSKQLNTSTEPSIIISAAGMATAGRVKHHLQHGLSNGRNAVLIIGYAEPSSLANRLVMGAKEVRIFGEMIPVNAKIHEIDFFSAHADQTELLRFLSSQRRDEVDEVFLVHGNESALNAYKTKLEHEGFKNVTIAEPEEEYKL